MFIYIQNFFFFNKKLNNAFVVKILKQIVDWLSAKEKN